MNKGHGKFILQVLGILMPVTYLGMIITGSIPILIGLTLLNGVAWGFWPILFTVPFHLPGIRPRQLAVAVAFTMMMSSFQVLGILMPVTYLGMIITGSIPILIGLTLLNGVAWGFWPILFTVPFHLPGIRPRQLAVAVAFTMMMSSVGTALGPLTAGLLQQALGDLKLTLFIISFTGFSLTAAGIFLHTGTHANVEVPEPPHRLPDPDSS